MQKKLLILPFFIGIIFAEDLNEKKSIEFIFGKPKSTIISKQYGNILDKNFTIVPKYHTKNRNIELKVLPYISDNNFIFKELYLGYSFKKNSVILGRFITNNSSSNELISSGSMVMSNNTLPIPRIGFRTKNNLFKITYSFEIYHGIMEKNENINKAPFLHEKKLYLKKSFDKSSSISLGIHHAAIWAGSTIKHGLQPSSFLDFVDVFLADKSREGVGNIADQGNSLGDSRGMWDLSYNKEINEQKYKIYYQIFFEDKSGLKLKNNVSNFDGLYGIEIKSSKFIFLYEYLKTTYQGGNVHPPGIDSYYVNGTYAPGWLYKNFSIGNSFINPFNNRAKINHIFLKRNFNYNSFFIDYSFGKHYLPYIYKEYNETLIFDNDKGKRFSEIVFGYDRNLNSNLNIKLFFEKTIDTKSVFLSLVYNINNSKQ